MTRDDVINELQQLCSELAKEFGFNEMVVGEDRQKGIWGEKLTEWLEAKYGSCTKEIRWFSNDQKSYVEFWFRFASPVLSIRLKDGAFGSIQIDQKYNPQTKQYEGDFCYREGQIFEEKGVVLFCKLLDSWHKIEEAYKNVQIGD